MHSFVKLGILSDCSFVSHLEFFAKWLTFFLPLFPRFRALMLKVGVYYGEVAMKTALIFDSPVGYKRPSYAASSQQPAQGSLRLNAE